MLPVGYVFVHAACSLVRLIQMLFPRFGRVPRNPMVGAAEKVRELGVAGLMRAVSILITKGAYHECSKRG
jgi:hypothetical protein